MVKKKGISVGQGGLNRTRAVFTKRVTTVQTVINNWNLNSNNIRKVNRKIILEEIRYKCTVLYILYTNTHIFTWYMHTLKTEKEPKHEVNSAPNWTFLSFHGFTPSTFSGKPVKRMLLRIDLFSKSSVRASFSLARASGLKVWSPYR